MLLFFKLFNRSLLLKHKVQVPYAFCGLSHTSTSSLSKSESFYLTYILWNFGHNTGTLQIHEIIDT